jgi:3-hydroxyisobutyrate dehydrogenase-like beta-hydroxyacid dehydrogenase
VSIDLIDALRRIATGSSAALRTTQVLKLEPNASVPSVRETAAADTQSQSNRRAARSAVQGQVGFIGLGRMGKAMAANLAAAGHVVIAYVRREEQAGALAALGLNPTTEMAELFDCEFVVTMVPDDDAVGDIVFGRRQDHADGLAGGMMPGAIHLSMSTISTAMVSRLASEQARHWQGYVAAPVFGNPDAAKARELFIIAGGSPRDLDRCQPIFDAIGRQVFRVGDDPATANLVKLAGNAMSAATLEILGEVLALARKRGCDPRQLLAILTGTMFDSRVHKIYGRKIAEQQYGLGGFVFPLALKDVRLALAEAEAAGVPMPSVSVVRDRLVTGIARGYSELDWSALGLLAAEEAGLSLESAKG